LAKFAAAKEDNRLLALETAVDARASGILPLQYVQLWMAVERLLSFKTETSSQLAFALTALVENARRPAEFDHAKAAYNLRSRIAHGYDFKRDHDMYESVMWIAARFRQLMELSLGMEDASTLKDELINHVLVGNVEAMRG
jgi:hypothetical protein